MCESNKRLGMLSEIRPRIIGEKNRIKTIIVIFASNRVVFAQFVPVNGQIKVNSVYEIQDCANFNRWSSLKNSEEKYGDKLLNKELQ